MSKYRIGAYVPDGHVRHPRERKEKHRCGVGARIRIRASGRIV